MGKQNNLGAGISASFFESMKNSSPSKAAPSKRQSQEKTRPGTCIGVGRPRKGTDKSTADKETYQTSTRFVLEQYKVVNEIRRRENNSLKDELYLLINEGITKYCKAKGISYGDLLAEAENNW